MLPKRGSISRHVTHKISRRLINPKESTVTSIKHFFLNQNQCSVLLTSHRALRRRYADRFRHATPNRNRIGSPNSLRAGMTANNIDAKTQTTIIENISSFAPTASRITRCQFRPHRVRLSLLQVKPSEIFPVKVRTTGHGIATAMGKLGGLLGVFTFPFFIHWHGLPAAEGAAAIVSLLGLVTTIFLLPETKGKSLEELSEEPSTPIEKAAA